MTTNSTLVVKNLNGTYSLRYHHFDGYPKGLGLFLSTYFQDDQKVQWLFSHNRGFLSLMNPVPEEHHHRLNNSHAVYPASFGVEKNTVSTFLSKNDNNTILNDASWEEITCASSCTSYTYVYDQRKWHLVMHQSPSRCFDLLVAVNDFFIYEELILNRPTMESLSNASKPTENKSKTQGNLLKVLEQWHHEPAFVKKTLQNYVSDAYNCREKWNDGWLSSFFEKNMLKKSLARKTHPKTSPPKKM